MIKTCDQCKKQTSLKEQISYQCFCWFCHFKEVEKLNYALELTYKDKFALCVNAYDVEQIKKQYLKHFNTTSIVRER